MVARVRLLQARVLPHGWLDVLRQVSLFGAAYLAYRLVRGLVEGEADRGLPARPRPDLARAHAALLRRAERPGLGVGQPPADGRSPAGCTSTRRPSVTIGALLYLYLRHNRSFYFVRNMFMVAMAIALVGYTVFPTAPPRFLPEWGFIDTVSDFTGVHVSTPAPRSTRCSTPTRRCRRCTSPSR